MNKLISKIVGAVLGVTMATGIGVGVAMGVREREFSPAYATTTTFTTTSSGGFSNNTKTVDGVTVTFAQGTGSAISWQSGHVRVYQNNTITISSTDSITEIAFTVLTGSDYTNTFTASPGTVDTSVNSAVSWTGSTTSVVFTKSAGKQARVTSIAVTHGAAVVDYSNDSNLPSTITILHNSTFTDTLPTASGDAHTSATPNKVSGVAIREAGLYNNGSGYIMFKSGAGYLYNVESIGRIGSIKLEYTSGSSNSGKVLVIYGANKIPVKSTASHTAIDKTNGNTFSNDGDYGFFQISTSSANVQITTITITLAAPSVSITYAGSTSLEYDGSMTQTLSLTASPSNISGTINYVWASDDSCLALTSANGTTSTSATFTIFSAGSANITVQAKVSGTTKATSDALSFTITNKSYPGTLTITSSPTINIDTASEGTVTYSLTRTYTDNTLDVVTVTSSDEDVIAFVDENPLAYTAMGAAGDTATITLTLSCSENDLESYSTTQLITLTDGIPVTGLTLNMHSRTVTLGGSTMTLKATIDPSNATNPDVIWTSSDESVVTVSGSATNAYGESTGTLHGVNVGTATVTAKSAYDNTISDSATVTVNAPADKALESIAIVKGAGAKTHYTIDDTTVDTTGLSLSARYLSPTISTYDETVSVAADASGVAWTLDKTNLKVIASYGGKTDNFDISVSQSFAKNKGEYRLLEAEALSVGDHIAIGALDGSDHAVYGGHEMVMHAHASNGNNVQCNAIIVSSKNIISNDESNNTDKDGIYDIELIEGTVAGSFGLKIGEGQYLQAGFSSNYLKVTNKTGADTSFIFEYDSTNHVWDITCQASSGRNKMWYNPNKSNNVGVISCYGTWNDAYSKLKVYKFDYYVDEATRYAEAFNNANVCGTNDNTKADATKWATQETNFAALTLGAQNLFTNGTGTGSAFNECLERYDRVMYLHYTAESATYHDFMGRVANHQVTPRTSAYTGVNLAENDAIAIVVTLFAVLSFTTLGGYFLLRKKKEER